MKDNLNKVNKNLKKQLKKQEKDNKNIKSNRHIKQHYKKNYEIRLITIIYKNNNNKQSNYQ